MIENVCSSILQELNSYLQTNEILFPNEGTDELYNSCNDEQEILKGALFSEKDAQNIEALIGTVGKSFHDMLFCKIKEKGMKEVEVYKRANMDRRFFAKIKNNPEYHPRKKVVLALSIALRLNLEETIELLSTAEYALSSGNRRDLIVKYYIEKEIFDINVINQALEAFGQELLG